MSDVTEVMDLGAEEPRLSLPPGFRFHPTDEEVVTHYLTPKAVNNSFSCLVIADVDLNKTEPWDLPGKAKMGRRSGTSSCTRTASTRRGRAPTGPRSAATGRRRGRTRRSSAARAGTPCSSA